MNKVTEINDFKIISSKETIDKQAPNNTRNRQFRIRVYYKNKQIKTSYFLTKKDQIIALNLLLKILDLSLDIHKEPVESKFNNNCIKELL